MSYRGGREIFRGICPNFLGRWQPIVQIRAKWDGFPVTLRENREGIHLWGSLTYEAFDETCCDVDCIAVARLAVSLRNWTNGSGKWVSTTAG
jgi:hypothetical protein